MATLKIAALMVLLYGIIKDSWASIFFAMILWEIGGGFVLTSLFYLTNRSGNTIGKEEAKTIMVHD